MVSMLLGWLPVTCALIGLASSTSQHPMTALSDRVLFQYRKDPTARIDSFETLSHHDREELWSFDDGTTLQQKISHLENFTAISFIDVKLVGFDGLDAPRASAMASVLVTGEGHRDLNIPEKTFLRFFEDLKPEVPVSVLQPNPPGASHTLPLRVKQLYQIVKARPELTREIQHALHDSVITHSNSRVPVDVVDKILEKDFRETSLSTTVYILNPKIPVDHRGHEAEYSYHKEGSPCPTSAWVSSNERFLWVDLGATTPSYGPSTMGDGVVTEYQVPRLTHYTKQGQVLFHELVSHLVTLVKRTCRQLVNPSLQYFPISLTRRTFIQLLRIKESSNTDETHSRFDWSVIKKNLSTLWAANQELSFNEFTTTLAKCPKCTLALESARRTMTSTPEGSQKTYSTDYIDSKVLHASMSRFMEDLPGHTPPQFPGDQVVHVYLYDLDEEDGLLLDQQSQAVGFDGIVLAIQSQAGKLNADMQCDSKPVSVASDDATRATLAALLTSVWGVTPPHVTWDEGIQKPVYDYMWSVTETVFGSLSAGKQLTFPVRDAAARAVLYTAVNDVLAEAHGFASGLAKYNKELDELLSHQEHKLFLQRWNVFKFKLEKAGLYLSLHNFDHSLYYLRSVQHDLKALHAIIHKAG